MYRHAAKLAAQPNSSLKAPSVAYRHNRERNEGCSEPSFDGGFAAIKIAAVWANFKRREGEDDFGASEFLPPRIPSSARGHASGLSCALRQARSSASAAPPFGLRFPASPDPPQMQSFGLGSRGHSLALPSVTRAEYGKFNETEITTMYQNKVTLIGFLGADAEVRSNDNRSLTTLSLATKSSYKKDGKYIEHTEWHRCVVFGKLGEFAATLKKGAHIQVEGELRSRKYDSKKTNSEQTIWEIRVNSILKLDRAQKASAEDDDAAAEEEAA